ncbi:MAG: hypothetical protein V7677_10735 [Motiliproteus sp.]
MWDRTLWLLCVLLLSGCSVVPEVGVDDSRLAKAEDSRYQSAKTDAIAAVIVRNKETGVEEYIGETTVVYLSDFNFSPNEFRFKSGTVTRIRLKNVAWVTHYFGGKEFFAEGADIVNILGSKIPSQQHVPASPYVTRDLYLYIKKPGEYPLSCFVPNHRIEGMTGRLIVEP